VAASPTTTGLSGCGTGSTTTVSGLTAGITYTFTVSVSVCTSGISSNVAINLPTVNGTSWSGTPDLTKTGVYGNSTISTDVDLCSCTIRGYCYSSCWNNDSTSKSIDG
jgi:hypothetical protein